MHKNSLVSTVCVCATIVVCVVVVSIAGPLNPPGGPPASTFKTLDEIEPRRPINDVFTPGGADAQHIISSSGSYYLTGPLTVSGINYAIEVRAPDVTIDLNGYTITGSNFFGAPLTGIRIPSTNLNAVITVRNGTVTGFENSGVRALDSSQTLILRDLVCASNGVGAASSGVVDARDCSFLRNTGSGISGGRGSIVRNCRSLDNGFFGISAISGIVEGCVAQGNGVDGISVGFDDTDVSIVRNSVSSNNSNRGISGLNAIVEGNAVAGNENGGIRTLTQNSFSSLAAGIIANNFLKLNGDAPNEIGIDVTGAHYRVDQNTISGSPVGIMTSTNNDNVVTRNTVHDATTAYDVPAGNVVPVLDVDYSTDRAWQNIEQ